MSSIKPTIICTVTTDLTYDQRMIRICNSLVAQGYEVSLLGRKLPESMPLATQPYHQKRLSCYFRKGKLFYLEFNLRLLIYLFWHPFDLVCAVDLDTLAAGFIAGRLKGCHIIYDAHEYFTELPEVVDRPFTRNAWRLLARLIIPRLRYTYTVGPALAGLLSKRYGTAFSAIRNLPYRRTASVQTGVSDPRIILYQGRLNAGRGLETAILAMHHVKGAELWLVGEGDLSQTLRELVRQEQLEGRVRFLGYQSPEILQRITLEAFIGLNLLEPKGLSYYYSLANKAFDYIQAGLPSIQPDFPEYRALQDTYAVFALIETLDVEHLVASIKELLTDHTYWEALHQNCLAAREKLCWEVEEKKLAEYYRDILGHR